MEVLIIAGLVCAVGCAVVGRLLWPRRPEGLDSRRIEGDSGLERVEDGVELLDRRLEELEERVDFSEQILMERPKKDR